MGSKVRGFVGSTFGLSNARTFKLTSPPSGVNLTALEKTKSRWKKLLKIGLIGLAVMGQNLVLNMADHGYRVAVFNRTTSKVDDFLNGPAKNTTIMGTYSLEELVTSLEKPRKVMLMVKAGDVVDRFIDRLVPVLEPGDVIIDGGNSYYPDSTRRTQYLRDLGLRFIGTGISGGEEGARHGPSIMPGGDAEAWPLVKDIFQSIAAKVADGSRPRTFMLM